MYVHAVRSYRASGGLKINIQAYAKYLTNTLHGIQYIFRCFGLYTIVRHLRTEGHASSIRSDLLKFLKIITSLMYHVERLNPHDAFTCHPKARR